MVAGEIMTEWGRFTYVNSYINNAACFLQEMHSSLDFLGNIRVVLMRKHGVFPNFADSRVYAMYKCISYRWTPPCCFIELLSQVPNPSAIITYNIMMQLSEVVVMFMYITFNTSNDI